jgi:hypothetical protein
MRLIGNLFIVCAMMFAVAKLFGPFPFNIDCVLTEMDLFALVDQ